MTISSAYASNSISSKWVVETPRIPLRMKNSSKSCKKRANKSGDNISPCKTPFKILIISDSHSLCEFSR